MLGTENYSLLLLAYTNHLHRVHFFDVCNAICSDGLVTNVRIGIRDTKLFPLTTGLLQSSASGPCFFALVMSIY